MPYYLKILKPTSLNRDTSQQPVDPETPPLKLLGVIREPDLNGQIKFTLEGEAFQGLNTWFIPADACQVIEQMERKPEDGLTTTDLNRDLQKRGPLLALPGLSGAHMYDCVGRAKNFTWAEMTRNGERMPEDASVTGAMIRLAEMAQTARDRIGKPFMITSGYRPPAINRAVGGVSNSRHIVGDAFDMYWEGATKWEMYDALDSWWPGGLGMYRHNSIIHIDARSYRARWGR